MERDKCQALFQSRTTRQALYGGVIFDLNGRRIELPDVEPRPGEVELTITCQRCNLNQTIRAEGDGPFGAFNEATRQARDFLRSNCGGWKEKVAQERRMGFKISDTPPDTWLP